MRLERHRLDVALAREANGLGARERRRETRADEELPEEDTEGEDIGASVRVAAGRDLGRHRRRAVRDATKAANARCRDPGGAGLEVAHLHFATRGEEDLSRRERMVDHAELHALVIASDARARQALGDLRPDEEREVERKAALLRRVRLLELAQRYARDELRDEERSASPLAALVDAGDVRVVDARYAASGPRQRRED